MGEKVLQISGEVIWIKELLFNGTKLPLCNPGQGIGIIVFYFISKLLFFLLMSERFTDILCLFVVYIFSWSVI